GVVHEDVAAPVPLQARLDHPLAVFGLAGVAGQPGHVRPELVRRRLQRVGLAGGDEHVGTGVDQGPADALADAFRPARDDGGFAAQPEFHRPDGTGGGYATRVPATGARRLFSSISSMISGQRGRGRSWAMSGYITSRDPATASAVAMPPDGRTRRSANP